MPVCVHVSQPHWTKPLIPRPLGRAVRVGPVGGGEAAPALPSLPEQVPEPPSRAIEGRQTFFSPPTAPISQPTCVPVLVPGYLCGQEVAQAVNSWIDSGNDKRPRKKKELVYSGLNATCAQTLTSISSG